MQTHHLSVTKTARYYQLGTLSSQTTDVWIACHGYGQLAAYFIKKFESVADSDTCVIAPEGLHRFYTEGSQGRVGASWMTREDRLHDIADYITYLDTLYALLRDRTNKETRFHVLGFSQGCATVSRWINQGEIRCHSLILWAGVFPPDMEPELLFPAQKAMQIYLVAGTHDAFVDEERLALQFAQLQQAGLTYTFLPFEGGHRIESGALQALITRIKG